jgi:hypothetical protein
MKYKYDKEIVSLKFELQQVVYQLDRSVWAREGFDQDWHFDDAIKMLEQVMFKVSAWQQDQEWMRDAELDELDRYNSDMREVDDEIPF